VLSISGTIFLVLKKALNPLYSLLNLFPYQFFCQQLLKLKGTPSRTIEGAFLGAFFILGSSITKKQVLAMGGSKTVAALLGGMVGGVAQAVVMTPAGMVSPSHQVYSSCIDVYVLHKTQQEMEF
jgi:hypothetical protein